MTIETKVAIGIAIMLAVVVVGMIAFLATGRRNTSITATVQTPSVPLATASTPAPHAGHAHTPSAHHEPAKKGVMDRIWEFLGLIFALLILFMVASAAWGFYKWLTTTPTPPAVTSQQEVSMNHKLYRFENYPGGCKSFIFTSYFKAYPKGGKMRMYFPDGHYIVDEPGVDTELGDTPYGEYKFCTEKNGKDPAAWGVEVWTKFTNW